MKKHSKEKIFALLTEQGVLPMFSHDDPEVALQLLQAVYNGGARLVEFTNRNPNALPVFRALKSHAQSHMPDLVLGAGTIMHAKEAEIFTKAGAAFIIAPVIDKGVAKFCRSNKIFWCPGAATLTEIIHAHELGAAVVKLFPAVQLGGPAFVKAVMAPCPGIKLMPTGGVDTSAENLTAWFNAGVQCVGIGSQLFSKDILEKKNYKLLSTRMKQMLRVVKKIRQNNK